MGLKNLNEIDIDAILEADKSKEITVPDELSFMNRMKRGNVHLACAKTGVGKSLFLRQFACAVGTRYKVLYISLENDTATDMEHFRILKDMYHPENVYYHKSTLWKRQEIKDKFKEFDIVCIDGLETTVCASPDKSFEIYSAEVNEIKKFFSGACVWLSWQMGRQFSSDEPTIEDIAFSYAAARLAYSAVGIYWKNDQRHIKNIKGRGGNVKDQGILEWGCRFQIADGNKKVTPVPAALEEDWYV